MDTPEILNYLSEAKGVRSTHLHNPESMQQLADKTKLLSEGWKTVADEMAGKMPEKEKKKIELFKRYLLYKEKG